MKDIEKVLASLKPVIEKLMFSKDEELKEFGSALAGLVMAKEASQEEFDLVKMPIFLFALGKFKEEETLKEELSELGINLGGGE
jgi:hypothetical protein